MGLSHWGAKKEFYRIGIYFNFLSFCKSISIVQIIMAKASESELKEAFKLFDTDGDGIITHEEVIALINKIGGSMTEAEAQALVSKADKNQNKDIDFAEFSLLWEALHGDGEAEFREKFSKLDIDNSGYITKEEMLEVVASGVSGIKTDDAKAAIDNLDVDKDGKVSYPEFLLVMKFKKS